MKINMCGYEFSAVPVDGGSAYEVRRRWGTTGDQKTDDVGFLRVVRVNGLRVITPGGAMFDNVRDALESHAAACIAREYRMSGGFLLRQLDEAFRSVCNPNDWKGPVMATISRDDLAVVAEAVRWYTGTELRVIDETENELVVAADGYRAGPCGDH